MSLGKNLAVNIKRLREENHLTQEQLAQALNLSFQAVSKWENEVTVPDTLMLPKIAQYFGTTVDSLFCRQAAWYKNSAQMFLAKYEESKSQDDFIRADAEFRKLLEKGEPTWEDIRSYGILYEFHMYYCRDKALEEYRKVLANNAEDEIYYRTRRQQILMLTRIGRQREAIAQEKLLADKNPDKLGNHVCLALAYYAAGQYELGYKLVLSTVQKLADKELAPDLVCEHASLYAIMGDICEKTEKYDEAFACWDRALEIDSDCADSMYSIALCYQKLERFEEEANAWRRLVDWLGEKGAYCEMSFPKQMLNSALTKFS